MKPLTLAAVADFAKGAIEKGRLDDVVMSVSTDTRSLEPGALFVALKGENFDGHRFAGAAAAAGAKAVMVGRGADVEVPDGVALLRVGDTLAGLQSLAACYRNHLKLTVIAVTGSNGKTSTKDLIASVLAQECAVTATRGNFNNHIGLPLTILQADDTHEFAVWEMGMSNPGEIAALAEIAAPDVGVITNIGVAHIEFMKSREAIAEEKGSLATSIGERGLVVLNADDEFTPAITESTRARVVTAGISKGDFRAEGLESTEDGSRFTLCAGGERQPVELRVPGRHMVANALLAAAVGSHMGLSLESVASGLAKAALTGGRLGRREIAGVTYIDDSYNANPDSMLAALGTLAELGCKGRRFAVLGGMAELGEHADSEHRRIGAAAAEAGIDYILSVGELARPVADGVNGAGTGHVEHFADLTACAGFLAREVREGDLVLVKGSRSSAMERIFEALEDV